MKNSRQIPLSPEGAKFFNRFFLEEDKAKPVMIACLTLRLTRPLFVGGQQLAPKNKVLCSYTSPGYDKAPGWVVEVAGMVVELFHGDYEKLTVCQIERSEVPARIRKYIDPCDHRGFTTMPHRADQQADWH